MTNIEKDKTTEKTDGETRAHTNTQTHTAAAEEQLLLVVTRQIDLIFSSQRDAKSTMVSNPQNVIVRQVALSLSRT